MRFVVLAVSELAWEGLFLAWQMFKEVTTESVCVNLEVYTLSFLSYIKKCVENKTTGKLITITTNQKFNFQFNFICIVSITLQVGSGCFTETLAEC